GFHGKACTCVRITCIQVTCTLDCGQQARFSTKVMDKIEDCISFLLGKAQQRVMRRAKELLAEYEVTPVQYASLCVLWEQDGQTGADLGGRLVIDSATMTGIVDRLERSGLVERRADTE